MEKIYYLLQGFLGLILSGHIPERHAGLLFHIHLGIALADSHHAAALAHPPGHPDDHSYQKCDWQEGCKKLDHNCRSRIRNLLLIVNPRIIQTFRQGIILYQTGIILSSDPFSVLRFCGDHDLITLDHDFFHVSVIHHFQKFIITDFLIRTSTLELIKRHDQKSGNQRYYKNKRQALPVIFIILIFILVVHFYPPVLLFHYKDSPSGNQ